MAEKIALIDGHALAFRAFHALKDADLRTAAGEPTYAVFGFAQILLGTLHEQHPAYVAVAFDVGRTFRDDLYAEYKAGRAETPAEFHPQLERIKQLVAALNIPMYTAEGYEADDVIGTLARQASAAGVDTLILTGDTDTLQLVDAHVQVILANPYGQKTTTTLYDLAKVAERYKGLRPDQLADLRGLKGDASDNIPGVNGIGEAGAISLLNQFGSVEGLYEKFAEVPNRYRKKIEGRQEIALFSKKLATIVCDVPVQLDLAAARLADYDRARVIGLFQELQFGAGSGLIKKLPAAQGGVTVAPLPADLPGGPQQTHMFGETVSPPAASRQMRMFGAESAPPSGSHGHYRAVRTVEQLQELLAALEAAPGFAFDIESNGLRPFVDELVGLALATQPGSGWYIPFGHQEDAQLGREQVFAALRPFFADPQRLRYAHNAKFDIEFLEHAGLPVGSIACDTMIAAGLLGLRPGLKDLAFYELQGDYKLSEPMTAISELIGRGAKQIPFAAVPIAQATPYAAADADMTLRLVPQLQARLAELPQVNDLFQKIEMPLLRVLIAMEQAGIGLDREYLAELSRRLGKRLAELESRIHGYAAAPFNINSTDQLSEVLFQHLGISDAGVGRTARTKKYSLTADTLELLQDRHPIFTLILQYRQLGKLKSTYVDALPALVNPRTGRVHTSYNQLGAATGRLSSNDPNLQNIPVRTEEGREIRRAFVARPGHRFIAADYSQIELRVLAHITQDENLVQAFAEGLDIHAATAAQLFGVEPDAVDKNQRRIAKTVVFGVIYGISAFGLAQRLSLPRSDAQLLIDALFNQFPGIRDYIDATIEQGRTQGYVSSLFGRRRAMPELQSSGPRRQAAEREAINAPIQATAADIMKMAMLNVAGALHDRALQTRLLLQVHDELILEAPEREVPAVVALLREVMENVYNLNVPLRIDVESGPNWEEMHNYE
jgi:DNA polymerase I